MSDKLYTPHELLDRLEAEHTESYVYRGESRFFSPPMWPSKYRDFFVSESAVSLEASEKVRGSGASFYFRLDFLRDPFNGQDAEALQALQSTSQLKQGCMLHIMNAVGYVLAQALFQQAGWRSECLDVSHSPAVAMTFAVSSWDESGARISARPEPAALYRFKVDPSPWTLDDLRRFNFYSCPTFIPTREIFRLFKSGTDDDFRSSLEEYKRAINWDVSSFDLDKLQNSRPFELLTLPKSWASKSRIELQEAALLVPDCSRQETNSRIAARIELGMMREDAINVQGERLSVRDCLNYGQFVEDVRTRSDSERFLMEVSSESDLKTVASRLNTNILPKSDSTFDLLSNWIKPFFWSVLKYQTLPLQAAFPDPEVFWKALGEWDFERRFSN